MGCAQTFESGVRDRAMRRLERVCFPKTPLSYRRIVELFPQRDLQMFLSCYLNCGLIILLPFNSNQMRDEPVRPLSRAFDQTVSSSLTETEIVSPPILKLSISPPTVPMMLKGQSAVILRACSMSLEAR